MIERLFKNILIIKWGALGDLIMSTSAIKAVREQYPDARITMFTNSIMEQLLPSGYLIDDYIIIKKSGRRIDEPFLRQLLLIRQLRRKKFDLAINMKWKSERASVLTLLSGAKVRTGYKEKNFINCYTHSFDHPEGRYHEVHRNLDIVRNFGIPVKNEIPLIYISDKDREFAHAFFTDKSLIKENVICIHPGASKINRAWPAERYIELAKKMIERHNVNILITWGKGELELAKKIAGSVGAGAVISSETGSIGELGALIQNSALFISVCTGPMNVANAVVTPIIAILGSTDPLDWSPYGEIHRTIKSPLILEHYTDEDEKNALAAVTLESVFNVVDSRWKELKAGC